MGMLLIDAGLKNKGSLIGENNRHLMEEPVVRLYSPDVSDCKLFSL